MQANLDELDAYVVGYDRPGDGFLHLQCSCPVPDTCLTDVFTLLMSSHWYCPAGYGESTMLRGRSLETETENIEDLAAFLGVDQFYLAAVSGGGPYALAAASQIPQRVKGVLLLSAISPSGQRLPALIYAESRPTISC